MVTHLLTMLLFSNKGTSINFSLDKDFLEMISIWQYFSKSIRAIVGIKPFETFILRKNMKRQSLQLSEKELPELRRIETANKTGWSYFGALLKTIHRELGEEKTREILSIFMAHNALEYVEAWMNVFGIDGLSSLSPCPWFQELDIPAAFCRALGTFEGEMAKIVNPNIKSYFAKVMTEGDTYYEPVFEEREG